LVSFKTDAQKDEKTKSDFVCQKEAFSSTITAVSARLHQKRVSCRLFLEPKRF
jgi:hypothetical protein